VSTTIPSTPELALRIARPSSIAPLALALACAALAPPALAGPADSDEPLIHPRRELDPRLELEDPSHGARLTSPLRAPIWFALDASLRRQETGDTSFGAMLLLGVPLDRLAAHDRHAGAVAEGPPPSEVDADEEDAHVEAPPVEAASDPPPAAPRPPAALAPPAALKPVPRVKLDVALPTQPPKLPPTAPAALVPPPLRIPVVVTPRAARDAVEAALRRAKLSDPEARTDAMASRVRTSAALPELRLRALRSIDQGQALAPTEYDPTRTTATGGSSIWMEARATWRLDRLVFADEEVALERLRHHRTEARTRLTARVLRLLFDWQRAMAKADNPAASPEENLVARLKALEAEAELDLLTDGWFVRWRAAG
jgi:hypothetical protein